MEPAPPPHVPAAGPGASPRRFRSARSSHGAHAGRWGAPGSASRPRTSWAPSRCRQRGSAAARELPAGSRLRHPTDAGDARPRVPADQGRPVRHPQPPRGSAEGAGQTATEVAECAPPLAPAATGAPLRQPRRVPAAAAAAPLPSPLGLPERASPAGQGPPPPPRLPAGRGAALHAPPGIPSRLARRSPLRAGGSDPLWQT